MLLWASHIGLPNFCAGSVDGIRHARRPANIYDVEGGAHIKELFGKDMRGIHMGV